MEDPRREPEREEPETGGDAFADPTVEADQVEPAAPGPGDSEGAPPGIGEDEYVRPDTDAPEETGL